MKKNISVPFYKLRTFIYTRRSGITLLAALVMVTIWTCLRFFANGINYDVVGQVGLADQWARHAIGGAEIGPTNYLLKFPLYMLINGIDGLAPQSKLLTVALICNLLTFAGLYWIWQKWLRLYHIQCNSWFYATFLWMASIAGGTFWLDYANSRNLELLGGFALLYLADKYLIKPSRPLWLGIACLGSLVFFADPLELYTFGVLGSLLGLAALVVKRKKFLRMLWLLSALATAAGVSAVLKLYATQAFNLTYLANPTKGQNLFLSSPAQAIRIVFSNICKEFSAFFLHAPYGVNSLREALNFTILICLIAYTLRLFAKHKKQALPVLPFAAITASVIVYIVSGLAAEDTSRYLLLIPPCLCIAFLLLKPSLSRKRKSVPLLWVASSLGAAVLLLGGAVIEYPQRNDSLASVSAALRYMHNQHFSVAGSDRPTGVVGTYAANGSATIVPLGCNTDKKVAPTTLFFDAAQAQKFYRTNDTVPILVPSGGIQFGKENCSQTDIAKQFGAPRGQQQVSGFGTAMLYSGKQLRGEAPKQTARRVAKPQTFQNPLPITTLPHLLGCENSDVTDVIVAHPDDDLLFMNPDLQAKIANGCVRTVYVTAGDDGKPADYWLGRQQGIRAAYAQMAGVDDNWIDRVTFVKGRPLRISSLSANPKIALLFIDLPDGNVSGQGFSTTNNFSLQRITDDPSFSISSLENGTLFSAKDLQDVLGEIIKTDEPATLFTHVGSGEDSIGDHSDHRAVGKLARTAAEAAFPSASIQAYFGYKLNGLSDNLSAETTAQKQAIFTTYASYDGSICRSSEYCPDMGTYTNYFSRMYVSVTAGKQPQNVKLELVKASRPDRIALLSALGTKKQLDRAAVYY